MTKKDALEKIAIRLRILSLKMTSKAGSGHPSTCLSMADLAACLFFDEMQYNISDPDDWGNDEFILSKGHAAPILWAAYAEAGIIPHKKLMDLRKITSPLEGHPTPRMKWVKAATGSLGQGLSVGVGVALAQKLAMSDRRTYVVLGDGEMAEGSVWEAANVAADLGLDNLCAVVDINRLGQSDPTMHQHNLQAFENKFRAFGWETFSIDGHNIDKILEAFGKARKTDRPAVILAKTYKGRGVSFMEDKNGWHGKPLKSDDLKKALDELGPMPEIETSRYVKKPKKGTVPVFSSKLTFKKNSYSDKIATRRAYGNALVNLGLVNDRVVCIDGDVKNSTYAEDFFKAFPRRSFQMYIAEQVMIGAGIGLSAKGFIPYMATFAAFLSRAHDQIRMAAYSMANIKVVGSHVGVSIGEDGPSQMGLEDMAIFRPIPGCVVLYPSDGHSTEACVESLARHKGISYLRTSRPATAGLYAKGEEFPIGGSKVLKSAKGDKVVVIAAGITVHEALKAYAELAKNKVTFRLIDAYSVQPLDVEGIRKEVRAVGGRVVVVEDHFKAGGLGEAVAAALAGEAKIIHLAVTELPRSGKPGELLERYGISASRIIKAVKQ
jgi:transketolase